ncbi:MAG: DUF4358 domain-containing protein [Bacteroides sp.]|nr:DUF4358 domain-containing protein [Eubacterium sp.]MCM1418992.1 DUF4358 domain-containing protein [Roseburia sp.]MCM1463114.1 DUF4358 domain-containing protein [Bacteroides sp.]
MKKKISALLLTAALIGLLASCAANEAETTTTPAPSNETTKLTEGTTAPEDVPDPEPTTDPGEAGDPESTLDPDSAEQSDCQRLTDAALNVPSLEEVATMQVDDDALLTDVMNYDLSLFEEYSVVTHLMSAHLIEITVAKPAEGKAKDALDLLEKRKDELINVVAFYPEQQENAAATIVGSKGDYVYLLCGFDSAEMEKALLAAIGE